MGVKRPLRLVYIYTYIPCVLFISFVYPFYPFIMYIPLVSLYILCILVYIPFILVYIPCILVYMALVSLYWKFTIFLNKIRDFFLSFNVCKEKIFKIEIVNGRTAPWKPSSIYIPSIPGHLIICYKHANQDEIHTCNI